MATLCLDDVAESIRHAAEERGCVVAVDGAPGGVDGGTKPIFGGWAAQERAVAEHRPQVLHRIEIRRIAGPTVAEVLGHVGVQPRLRYLAAVLRTAVV